MIRYAATPAVVELHTDEGGLVLLHQRLVHLGPVGSVIRKCAATPTTLAALTEALVSAFGVPDGDLPALTREAVDALVAQELLAVVDD